MSDLTTSTPYPATPSLPGAGRGLWLATLAFTLVVAVIGYSLTGTPGAAWSNAATRVPQAAGDDAPPTPEQIETMVQTLAERLRKTPDDDTGWQMLARAYLVTGRLAEAADAAAQVLRLRPDDPNALADLADVLALKQGRSLEGEPTRLIERALRIDSGNLKALALAGAAAFDRGDAAEAVRRWQRVIELGAPESPVVQQAREGVAEARRLLATATQAGAVPEAETAPAGPATGAGRADAAAPAASVRGQVRLDAALATQVGPDETVFVFARALRPDGSAGGMPLAILRRQVRDLPLAFTLDDTLAMGPGSGISSATTVVVSARISRSGQAMPQPGDLEGVSAPVPVGATGVEVAISRVVR